MSHSPAKPKLQNQPPKEKKISKTDAAGNVFDGSETDSDDDDSMDGNFQFEPDPLPLSSLGSASGTGNQNHNQNLRQGNNQASAHNFAKYHQAQPIPTADEVLKHQRIFREASATSVALDRGERLTVPNECFDEQFGFSQPSGMSQQNSMSQADLVASQKENISSSQRNSQRSQSQTLSRKMMTDFLPPVEGKKLNSFLKKLTKFSKS